MQSITLGYLYTLCDALHVTVLFPPSVFPGSAVGQKGGMALHDNVVSIGMYFFLFAC